MSRISRRSFIEKLGLGAGAVILSPIANTLVSEARGAVAARKIAIFFVHGNGLLPDHNLVPKEVKAMDPTCKKTLLPGVKDFTLPDMMKNLEPFKDRMLLIDSLPNAATGSSHSGGYTALSCCKPGDGGGAESAVPGGPTIDQFIADRSPVKTRMKAALFGISKYSKQAQLARTFAGAAGKPVPHVLNPQLLFDQFFEGLGDGSGANRDKIALKNRVILDTISGDIKKLQMALAGPERVKLDNYLAAIDAFDNQQRQLATITCGAPARPTTADSSLRSTQPEDRLSLMTDLSILAVICGMTNVIGVGAGSGSSHEHFPDYFRKLNANAHYHEQPNVQAPSMDIIHNFHAGLLARMLNAFKKITEGGSTLYDNTAAVYMPDNGESHHSPKRRYSLYVVGNAGKKLKADGRFLRYPLYGAPGGRSLADFFCSIATACDVPTDTFGKDNGIEPVKGPLEEIMA